jgi:ABC-2 type transport system permease protein
MAGIAGSKAESKRRGLSAGSRKGVSFAIHPSHVRTLLWLRWKLTLRGYTRNTGRIVSLIFMLLFLVPLLGGLAFASLLGYDSLPHSSAVVLLFLVVTGIYLLWAALPLLFYTLNEGLDVTKLQIYPLTRGEQMVALVLATLLDLSSIFIVFFYAAILLGWHNTPAALIITAVALAAAYIHTVSLSQLTLAVLMGLLRTRRYRDVTIIIFALFGVVCSLSGQFLGRIFSSLPGPDSATQLAQNPVAPYLHWSPPGMAVQAIVSAGDGQYTTAVIWLGGSVLLIPLVLILWAWVLDRGITTAETAAGTSSSRRRRSSAVARADMSAGAAASVSDIVAGSRRAEISTRAVTVPAGVAAAPSSASGTRRRGWRIFSSSARAIAWKDALYLWRDPQLKAQLLSTLFLVVLILFPNILSAGEGSGPGAYSQPTLLSGDVSVLLAIVPAVLVTQTLTQNSLGMDRQGLQTLFLFPVRPLDILWGKNLFAGAFAMAFMTVLALIKAILSGGWLFVPLTLLGGLAAVLLVMGCGNMASVLLPFRWRQMRMGDTGSLAGENGCLRGILQMVVLGIVAVLLIPVAIALVAPPVLGHLEWYLISVPLVLVFGIGFHQIVTRLIAPVLQRRAPEILAVTVRET